jgi:hypothetical protein
MIQTDFQYFGTISFIKELYQFKEVYLNPKAPFTKMSFKNRCVIASSQGPLTLSIPIIGGRDQKLPIEEILIAYDAPWREQHLKAITVNYKRAPFFEYYEQSLTGLYQNKPKTLVSFLMACHTWVHHHIKAPWSIVSSVEENNTSQWDPNISPNTLIQKVYTAPFTPKIILYIKKELLTSKYLVIK